MTVGERDVARRFHQQVQTIVLRDALLVTFDDAGGFFRKLRLFRPRLELIRVAQFVIRDPDNRDSRYEERKRDDARDDRHFGPQAKSNRTSPGQTPELNGSIELAYTLETSAWNGDYRMQLNVL